MYVISGVFQTAVFGWTSVSSLQSVKILTHLCICFKKFKPIELSLSLPFYSFSSLFQLFTKQKKKKEKKSKNCAIKATSKTQIYFLLYLLIKKADMTIKMVDNMLVLIEMPY